MRGSCNFNSFRYVNNQPFSIIFEILCLVDVADQLNDAHFTIPYGYTKAHINYKLNA